MNLKHLVLFVSALVATQSFAQEFRAEPVSYDGVVTNETITHPVTFTAKVPVYSIRTEMFPRASTCEKVVCREIPGNGVQGDWKGYFTAPHAQKAKRLAEAVKGIGIKSAERIVAEGNLFVAKPRSWNAFTMEVEKAERVLKQHGFRGSFAQQVIHVYGVENSKTLGYYSESACRTETVACTVMDEREVKQFAYTVERQVNVQIKNAVLQNFESERFRITVGMNPTAIEIQKPSTHNTYTAALTNYSSNFAQVTLTGVGRIRGSLPSEAGTVSAFKNSAGLLISGSVNPNYLPQANDAASDLRLEYRVCQTNFFGGCHKEMVDWTQGVVREARFTIQIPMNVLKKGSKHKVWYKFVRTGSRFYNNEGSTETTDSVKIP